LAQETILAQPILTLTYILSELWLGFGSATLYRFVNDCIENNGADLCANTP
jgi:hypothetical protein